MQRTAAAPRRIDAGRLVMVPAAAVLLLADAASLAARRGAGPLQWLGAALTCLFYALIIGNYLRRGPAKATSRSVTGAVAAVAATALPVLLPLLHGPRPGGPRQLAADLLLTAGLGWSVWALRSLGASISVLAQARAVADRGPYRLVRHPLYAGEIAASLGVALASGSAPALAAWAVLVALQAWRARQEETVLLAALPGYGEYRARTAALLPGIF